RYYSVFWTLNFYKQLIIKTRGPLNFRFYMKSLIPVLFILSLNFTYSQEPEELFSTALLTHLKNYKIQTEDAFENGELERGRSLFDTLVNQHLKGTRFDNFKFQNFDDDS